MNRTLHQEETEGLSIKKFYLCFAQFVSIRGEKKFVYSANLVAAENELYQVLGELIGRHQEIHTAMTCQEIEFPGLGLRRYGSQEN